MTKLTRRNLMTAAAATGLAGVLGSRLALAADAPLGITLVVPSPIGDVGWGHALAAGLEPIKAAYGDKVKVTVLENIAEGPDADRIMAADIFLVSSSQGSAAPPFHCSLPSSRSGSGQTRWLPALPSAFLAKAFRPSSARPMKA